MPIIFVVMLLIGFTVPTLVTRNLEQKALEVQRQSDTLREEQLNQADEFNDLNNLNLPESENNFDSSGTSSEDFLSQ